MKQKILMHIYIALHPKATISNFAKFLKRAGLAINAYKG